MAGKVDRKGGALLLKPQSGRVINKTTKVDIHLTQATTRNFEIRNPKHETNSNVPKTEIQNAARPLFGTFVFQILAWFKCAWFGVTRHHRACPDGAMILHKFGQFRNEATTGQVRVEP